MILKIKQDKCEECIQPPKVMSAKVYPLTIQGLVINYGEGSY